MSNEVLLSIREMSSNESRKERLILPSIREISSSGSQKERLTLPSIHETSSGCSQKESRYASISNGSSKEQIIEVNMDSEPNELSNGEITL
jgi:hypothetical protein